MCYSKYGESLLDEIDNRKVDDIEVKEIETSGRDRLWGPAPNMSS